MGHSEHRRGGWRLHPGGVPHGAHLRHGHLRRGVLPQRASARHPRQPVQRRMADQHPLRQLLLPRDGPVPQRVGRRRLLQRLRDHQHRRQQRRLSDSAHRPRRGHPGATPLRRLRQQRRLQPHQRHHRSLDPRPHGAGRRPGANHGPALHRRPGLLGVHHRRARSPQRRHPERHHPRRGLRPGGHRPGAPRSPRAAGRTRRRQRGPRGPGARTDHLHRRDHHGFDRLRPAQPQALQARRHHPQRRRPADPARQRRPARRCRHGRRTASRCRGRWGALAHQRLQQPDRHTRRDYEQRVRPRRSTRSR